MQSSIKLTSIFFLVPVNSGTTSGFNRDDMQRLLTPKVLGAIVGSVIALILFIAMTILMYKRRKSNKSKDIFLIFSQY